MSESDDNAIVIRDLVAGASAKTYQVSKSTCVDTRSYGQALKAAGWTNISDWARGIWTKESWAEIQTFLAYALNHRSLPMVYVVAIALQQHPNKRLTITNGLNAQELKRLKMLLQMNDVIDKTGKYMIPWYLQIESIKVTTGSW